MKTWLNFGAFWLFVVVASACSGPKRNFNSGQMGDAGESATSGGASGKSGGKAGRSSGRSAGEGGEPSNTEAGMGGDGTVDMAGAGGEPSTGFACGGLECAPEATCSGADADARCTCPTGYTDPRGDGSLCQDIDECSNLNGGCDALVACANTPGSFNCGGCPAGYTGSPSTGCVDIDECATNRGGCDKAVACTNTPGGRVCGNCPPGYSGTGDTACVDINECMTNNGGCDKTVTCNNTPGGHTCGDCPAGYSGGGASGCVDIVECATKNGGCDPLVMCSNTPGSFSCGACPTGYTGTGLTGCVDIVECATNNGGCSGNANCLNTAGSRTCTCKTGFTGDGTTCTNVDECQTNHGGCSANAKCQDTIGSRDCTCNTGYAGDGTACTNVDECATNHGGCSANAACQDTIGSRICTCNTNYSGDGTTCTLNSPPAGCKWKCTGSTCVPVALDADGDGHGTTACLDAPGDDCNDGQVGIFPGATELCDLIDNDCDKKLDLSDGMPLVGAIQNVPNRDHGAVASANDGSFGVLGTMPGVTGMVWGTISTTGVGSFGDTALFAPTSGEAYSDPHLAYSDGTYGFLWTHTGKGGNDVSAGAMGFTTCCWEDVAFPDGAYGDLTARGQGGLLTVATSFGNLNLTTRGRPGDTPLTSNLTIPQTGTYLTKVATSGTGAGVIWEPASPRLLNWSAVSSTLAFGTPETLSTTALDADLEAITAGYGLAWIEGVGFRFMIKKANGSTQCTSSVVPFANAPSNQKIAVSDSANGNVVVVTSPDNNQIRLYRFDNACKLVDDTDVSTTSTAPTEPRVVRGGSHVVVYWSDSSGGHYRFLSDQLCH